MSDTPETDAVKELIRTRDEYSLTDNEVWFNHSERMERERDRWHRVATRLVEFARLYIATHPGNFEAQQAVLSFKMTSAFPLRPAMTQAEPTPQSQATPASASEPPTL